MARKTAIHVTNAEVSAAEYRAETAIDLRTIDSTRRQVKRQLEQWRRDRHLMTPDELLRLSRAAARLECRGKGYSADDRADVAADIMRVILIDTGGAMPREDSPRVQLGRLCGDAKNRRRAIDATRERDRLQADSEHAAAADAPDALGRRMSPSKSSNLRRVAAAGQIAAERAASALCRDLNLPVDVDSPAWLVAYQWARDLPGEECAAERGIAAATWHVKIGRGRTFLRGFYSAVALADQLTEGAAMVLPPGETRTAAEIPAAERDLVFVLRDLSRAARHRTPILADIGEHWREGTDAGHRPVRPETAEEARGVCAVSRQKVRPKRDRERARIAAEREAGGTQAHLKARALQRLGYALSAGTNRRERAASAKSTLERALIGA